LFFIESTILNGWNDENTFTFWLPCQVLSKGGKDGKPKVDAKGRRWIQGIASTSARDLQGEVVDQAGLDFSYFLKRGYFNWDHKPGEDNRVGEPTEAKITKNGLWVKGYLYPAGLKKTADDIWEHMHAVQAAGSNRKMGFSIQGKVQRREGSTIKKCWIQEVAVTSCPVNTTTWAEIAKSLSAQGWDPSQSHEDDDEEKALTVGAGGNPLVPESLDSDVKDVRTQKSLSFDESVKLVESTLNIDRVAADNIARVIFSYLGKEQ